MPTSFLNELSAFSARIGKDPLLVQAAGGNTSFKKKDMLYIKASGAWLKDAENQDIFMPLQLSRVQNTLQQCQEDLSDTVIEKSEKRPSIETFLHALIPHTVVVHVHSINTIATSITASGRKDLLEKLSDCQVAFIPYERPGLPLALLIKETIKEIDVSRPLILILENHGLLIGAQDIPTAEKMLHEIERRLFRVARALPELSVPIDVKIPLSMKFSQDPLINTLSLDPICTALAKLGPLYPDHVVFLGETPLICPPNLSLNEFIAVLPETTPYAILPNVGVLVNVSISESAEEMLKAWANTLLRLSLEDNIHPLPPAEIHKLLHWDAEAFRQSHTRKS